MSSFWNTFNEPIIALAPMEDVTDTAMRELILKIADPSAITYCNDRICFH